MTNEERIKELEDYVNNLDNENSKLSIELENANDCIDELMRDQQDLCADREALEIENAKLKEQIDKMKCCFNCKWNGIQKLDKACLNCDETVLYGWELKK